MTSPNVAVSSRNARLIVASALVASAFVVSQTADFSPASAANGETCPGGSAAEEFYWQRADGTGARWPGVGLDPATSSQNTGFNIVAPLGSSGINLTATITDPANRNEDFDSPLRANADPVVSNWDGPLYTKTNGAYGLDYLTAVMGSVSADEEVTYEFQFTKPVLIPEFDIGDVDFIGTNVPPNDALHDSFQDEVEVFAERGGNPVSFTFEQGSPGTNQPTITGPNTVAGGVYGTAINGNLAPTDARGQVILRANAPVNSFGFNYSNGPDDEINDPAAAAGIPNVPAGSKGVSNNHAIRISGFTVCVGILEIGDTVFADYDGDGTQDPGEPGIPGVVIDLKDTDGNLIGTTTTGPTGSYNFDQLPPNLDYVIDPQEATLPGTTTWSPSGDVLPGDSIEDGTSTVTLTPTSSNVTNADFGYQPGPSTIAGTVWSDPEDNGSVGARDTGIAGVTVNLYDASGTTVVATTTTDADGNYSFSVQPGTYIIRESQPATYGDGQQVPGTNGSTNGAANDDINVTVDFGETSIENDYFEIPGSSIAGTVFEDADNDGVQGAAPGIAGVTVTLTGIDDGGNPVSLSTTTDSIGNYSFDNLRPGTYTVTESQPGSYTDGVDTPGSAGGSAAVNDIVSGIVLGANVAAVDYDFAEIPNPSLSGSVRDENGNPISGVRITATDGVSVYTADTLADGSYLFPSLPAGTYTVTETQPAGFGDVSTTAGSEGGNATTENVISAITLAVGDAATGYDFVEGFASIAGTVYEDRNNNGVQDSGEAGIPNASVTLNGTDPRGAITPITIRTDGDGNYLFGGLLAGTYAVTESTPSGYIDGIDANGSTGGSATNPGDRISGITLAAGEDAVDHDFGEIVPAGISGKVTDENGAPIAGVRMTLTGVDDLDNPITPIVVFTDADGNYLFADLPPGTYTVTESQPAGYGNGSESSPTGDTAGVNVITNLVITAGGSLPSNDFVETFSSIAGTVYVDVNDNGVQDAGEPGLPGVTVRLNGTDPNGAITELVATTGPGGTYLFDNLLAGSYTVTETTPAAFNDGKDAAGSVGGTAVNPGDEINSISLPGGTDSTAYNFGEIGTVLSGTVYVDDDRNGTIDPSEDARVGGVTIVLLDSGGLEVARTMTLPDGTYLFVGIPAGDYRVVEEQPTSYGTTTVNQLAVTVPTGGLTGVDFGEDLGSISNLVFDDLNGNGTQDAGEPGVAGVTVKLIDSNGDAIAQTVTAADGSYIFDRLFPDAYRVEFVAPAGRGFARPDVGTDTADSDADWVSGVTTVVDLQVDPATGLVNRRTDVDAGLVVAVIDLGVTISTPSTVVKVGDPVMFSYAPVNNSNVPVTGGIVVKTVLPSTVAISSVTAPGWTVVIDGQTVTLTLNDPSVLPGDPLPPFTVNTTVVNTTGSLNATVQIGTADGSTETTFANNDDAVTIQVAAAVAPTPTPTPGLPRTGTSAMAPIMLLALGFASIGALFIGSTRRRRNSTAG
jgi:SdrD B-like domain/Carboxypeptidase regulatory-like domain